MLFAGGNSSFSVGDVAWSDVVEDVFVESGFCGVEKVVNIIRRPSSGLQHAAVISFLDVVE